MRETLVTLLLGGGTFFAVVAAIGVVRMPDLFMRLSATTKASTLGASFILAAVALYFDNAAITGKILAIGAFTVLTAPVAAHMLGRAAYFSGVPLWEKSVRDDLRASGDGCSDFRSAVTGRAGEASRAGQHSRDRNRGARMEEGPKSGDQGRDEG